MATLYRDIRTGKVLSQGNHTCSANKKDFLNQMALVNKDQWKRLREHRVTPSRARRQILLSGIPRVQYVPVTCHDQLTIVVTDECPEVPTKRQVKYNLQRGTSGTRSSDSTIHDIAAAAGAFVLSLTVLSSFGCASPQLIMSTKGLIMCLNTSPIVMLDGTFAITNTSKSQLYKVGVVQNGHYLTACYGYAPYFFLNVVCRTLASYTYAAPARFTGTCCRRLRAIICALFSKSALVYGLRPDRRGVPSMSWSIMNSRLLMRSDPCSLVPGY